jgi:hypothetical protein
MRFLAFTFLPIFLLLLLGACGSPRVTTVTGGSPLTSVGNGVQANLRWFPLEVGAAWVYQGKLGDQVIGKKVFHCLREQAGLFLVEEYAGSRVISSGRMRKGSAGEWYYQGGEMRGGDGVLWLPGTPTPGNAWEQGPGQRSRVVAIESLFVPALGRTVKALRIDTQKILPESPSESGGWQFHRSRWFVQGAGVVQEETVYRPRDWKTSFATSPPKAPSGTRVRLVLVSRKP